MSGMTSTREGNARRVERTLAPVRRRLGAMATLRWMLIGWGSGALLVALCRLLALFWQDGMAPNLSSLQRWHVEWWGPGLCAGLAGTWRACRWPDALTAARWTDQRLQLQDRLTTAWHFAHDLADDPLKQLQIEDAVCHAQRQRPERAVPRVGWVHYVGPMCCWLLVLVWSYGMPEWSPARAARMQSAVQMAAVVQQAVDPLQEDWLAELRRIAQQTGSKPPEAEMLRALADDAERRLRSLQRDDVTVNESLAELSELQAAIAQASQEFSAKPAAAALAQLADALANVSALTPVAESLDAEDFAAAATLLEKFDPATMSAQERATLAGALPDVERALRTAQQSDLAEAVAKLGEQMADEPSQQDQAASRALAGQLQTQAQRQAIELALENQVAGLIEAKGRSRSGGNNIERSQEDRATWGRGDAGDPSGGAQADLATQRVREQLQGQAGEGPADRRTVSADSATADIQRLYQEQRREFARTPEQTQQYERLPLGHRQTIRRYFQAIQTPDAE